VTVLGPLPLRERRAGDVTVVVRPEQLVVETGTDARVRTVEYYGHDAVSLLDLPGGLTIRVRVLAAPDHRPGDLVGVRYAGGPAVAYPAA
jgi:iron(III) transport system ATP-binding protein